MQLGDMVKVPGKTDDGAEIVGRLKGVSLDASGKMLYSISVNGNKGSNEIYSSFSCTPAEDHEIGAIEKLLGTTVRSVESGVRGKLTSVECCPWAPGDRRSWRGLKYICTPENSPKFACYKISTVPVSAPVVWRPGDVVIYKGQRWTVVQVPDKVSSFYFIWNHRSVQNALGDDFEMFKPYLALGDGVKFIAGTKAFGPDSERVYTVLEVDNEANSCTIRGGGSDIFCACSSLRRASEV